MSARFSSDPQRQPVIDVREIPPRERHPLIFQTFDALAPGDALILVNDHEPRPLYYQFLHERGEQFAWRVMIERVLP